MENYNVYEPNNAKKDVQSVAAMNSKLLSSCEASTFSGENATTNNNQTTNFSTAITIAFANDQTEDTSLKAVDVCEDLVETFSTNKDLNASSPGSHDLLFSYHDTEFLKSFYTTVQALEVSNTELKQALSVLTEKYNILVEMLDSSNAELKFLSGLPEDVVSSLACKCNDLEKKLEELQCKNASIEQELGRWQSENDETKKLIQQITPTSFTTTTAEAHEASEKQYTVTTESQNDLSLIKSELQKQGHDLTDVTSLVKDVHGKMTWLESEFQKLMRRHSLIIENLCPKEDKSATEMFLVFVNSVLNVAIEDGEIDSVYVISQHGSNGSPEKRPRPILVTFACYGTRSRVYKAWLGFRSSIMQGVGALSGERGSGICIREYLTELQDSFYHEAMQVREKHLIADCWTFKGKTYIRTLDGDVREFNKEQWLSKSEHTYGCLVM